MIQQANPVWKLAQGRTVHIMGGEARGMLDGLLVQAERLIAA